jgi:hypothetical protein
MDKTSPKDIWDKLEEQFMSKTLTRKPYLKQKLYIWAKDVGGVESC